MATYSQENPGATGAERQIIAMHLGAEVYGVDIAAIHMVITPQAITPVPRTPDFIAGVINLRGRIVPVMDLRRRFGLPDLDGAPGRRIVIVESEALIAGLIVDSVSEVLRLPSGAVDPPAGLVASPASSCILGIGRVPGERGEGERLVILLDVAQTLAGAAESQDAPHTLPRAA